MLCHLKKTASRNFSLLISQNVIRKEQRGPSMNYSNVRNMAAIEFVQKAKSASPARTNWAKRYKEG